MAPHAVAPADDLQARLSALPVPLRDETLIAVPRPPDALVKLRQARVKIGAAHPPARHALLQPVPPPQRLPARELRVRDLPVEKDALCVLPRRALADVDHVDRGRDGTEARTAGSRQARGRSVVYRWSRSVMTHAKWDRCDLRGEGRRALPSMSRYRRQVKAPITAV